MTEIMVLDEKALTPALFDRLAFFSPFRMHPGFGVRECAVIRARELRRCLAEGARGRVLMADGRPGALVVLQPLSWDSEHFGVPMGRLYTAHVADIGWKDYRAFLAEALADMRSELNLTHVSAEVDIDDYASVNALAGLGFEILDIKRTYCANRLREDIDFVRGSKRVREFRESDRPRVRELARGVRFQSRFTRDRWLDPEKAHELYCLWFERLMDGAGDSTRVVVYERAGDVVACGGIGERDFSDYGLDLRLRTGSLYAGERRAVGAYTPVLYELTVGAIRSHGLVETTVSLNTVVTSRVLEGFRSNKGGVTVYAMRHDMRDETH